MLKIKCDRIIRNETLFDGYVYVDGNRIVRITEEDLPADSYYDYSGKYLSAGFIELHTHGGGGFSFDDGSAEDIVNASNFHLNYGVTTILPTMACAPMPELRRVLENIKQAKASEKLKGRIHGAHLEGPYFSPSQCGGQPAGYIYAPKKEDYESLIADYGQYITRWSYAPEKDDNGEFCKYITSHGIIASAGHTDAKYKDMLVAMENGCNLVTHLYSCTSTVTRDHGFRSLGVIETAYLTDDLYVEIIADGKHLPYDLIKMILKIKGTDKVALITDSLRVAGVYPNDVTVECEDMLIEDGVCKLKDRSAFKGSIATANVLLKTLVKGCGVAIPTAVKMLTEIPARILKETSLGKICEGALADLVVFDGDFAVSDVFVDGVKVV